MEHVNHNAALGYDNMNAGQTLYVRSPSGRYQAATDSHVLAAARIAAESLIGDRADMGNPNAVKRYFQAKLSGMGHEVAAVLYLNSQFKVIRYMEMSHGTLTQASVYPREIVKTALRLDAAAIIMSHNHPSGIPEPSEADLALTRHLKHALALVDVRLLDHIIVTGQNTTSLAERGQV
ncbi:MAG TPA: DNA repair protein RadC [Pusillimonas sp.]|jgi:DNA repair protein RadC|nr:DNA repair protein RadC [Pusillimonas sp.]MBC41648.1 DNA repair protein RadC [Pusillimonas sp.]HBT31827.1 DNA repair protein RadC [Pusillimonas sp.]|tara:strand:- start:13502 stop:14035 length:534 start_codon:yes stop_codon:yes gene_type:complete